MPDPAFRFVCVPSALSAAPGSWAREMLRDGEIALLPAQDGLAAVDAVARSLELASIVVVRGETTHEVQEQTVISHAGSLPLVWVAPQFTAAAREWAQRRGPMTLLIEAVSPLDDEERRRIERFVATLGRQSE